jgi:hypothetical protein
VGGGATDDDVVARGVVRLGRGGVGVAVHDARGQRAGLLVGLGEQTLALLLLFDELLEDLAVGLVLCHGHQPPS